MRYWFYVLGGAGLMYILWIVLVVGASVLLDNNIVVLQNHSPRAIDLTIGVTNEFSRWQVHLPPQACTLVQFQVSGDAALTTTVAGFASAETGYYTGSMGGVECLALPVSDCDLSALRCSSLILP